MGARVRRLAVCLSYGLAPRTREATQHHHRLRITYPAASGRAADPSAAAAAAAARVQVACHLAELEQQCGRGMASHRCWPYLLRFREGVRARPRARVRVRVRVRARVNPGASLGHTRCPRLGLGLTLGLA
jgi:hypothetical protein